MKPHAYLLPYVYNSNGLIEVLLGKKKIFSSRDAYILNNAGQYVIVGGKQERGMSMINAAHNEFLEEVGINLDIDQIDKYVYEDKKYSVYFYQVYDKSYFSKIHKDAKGFDVMHQELTEVVWFDIETAYYMMSEQMNNKPVQEGVKGREVFNDFLKLVQTSKTRPPNDKDNHPITLRDLLVNHMKKSEKDREKIIRDIYDYGINTNYYDEVKRGFFSYISKNAYTDWYANGINALYNRTDVKVVDKKSYDSEYYKTSAEPIKNFDYTTRRELSTAMEEMSIKETKKSPSKKSPPKLKKTGTGFKVNKRIIK